MVAFAAPALAQIAVVKTGDVVPLVGTVTRIDDVIVGNAGDWIVKIDTSGPASRDLAILESGVVKFQEGRNTGLALFPGAILVDTDSMSINDNGTSMYLMTIRHTTGSTAVVVLVDDNFVMEAGVTPLNAPGAPAGAVWSLIRETWYNTNDELLVGGRLSTGEDLLAKLTLDATGAIVSEEILGIEGATIPGHPSAIEGFVFSRRRYAMNASGSVLWYVDDETITPGGTVIGCCDNWTMLDGAPAMHEGDPTPTIPGNTLGSLNAVEVDLNDAGEWVAQLPQNVATTNLDIILKNGTEIVAAEGWSVPGFPGGWVLTAIGSSTGVFISDRGNVIWLGKWDIPNTSIDSGIFFDHELLVEEGVTLIDGSLVISLPANDAGMDVSNNGDFLLCKLGLANGTSGAYLFEVLPVIGVPYCGPAVANSTGVPGFLTAGGSRNASDNYVILDALDLPMNSWGFFLAGLTQGFVTNPGGSEGNLCLGGAIGRYVGPGQIKNSETEGSFRLILDLTQMPQPAGFVSVQSGDTWSFQTWHRDAVGGAATSNFTNGVEVQFL